MKPPRRSAVHPGTCGRNLVFRVLLFCSILGIARQQGDASRTWENLSRSFPSNAVYEPSSRNDGKSIVKSQNLGASDEDDATYSDEYEIQPPYVPTGSRINMENTTKPIAGIDFPRDASNTPAESNFSQVGGNEGNLMDQYETYYYYDDDDNNTQAQQDARSSENLSADSVKEGRNLHSSGSTAHHHLSLENEYDTEADTYSTTDSDPLENGSSMEGSNKRFMVAAFPSKANDRDKSILIGEAVVSVVTTKSVVNGTISVPTTPLPMTTEQIRAPPRLSDNSKDEDEDTETTENSRVVASVQTSRSISGARFLPFPVIERVQQVSHNINTNNKISSPSESTESIIDKLDRVQSELSSGFLTGGFRNSGNTLQLDVLADADLVRKSKSTTMKPPVISKFVPHRYNSNRKIVSASTTPGSGSNVGRTEDNIESLLPRGYPSYKMSVTTAKNTVKKSATRTATNEENDTSIDLSKKLKNVIVQDISAFLPPEYNLKKEQAASTDRSIINDILSKAKINISSLLPPDFDRKKESESESRSDKRSPEKNAGNARTGSTEKSLLDDIFAKSNVDISSLLPPGFDRRKESEPGSRSDKQSTEKNAGNSQSGTTEKSLIDDIFSKSKVDISSLLPPEFNRKKGNDSLTNGDHRSTEGDARHEPTQATVTTTTKTGGIKLVFPSRPGGRKPITRTTSPSPHHAEAPNAYKPNIQKGWPTRATTEFTGWPTPSTTPISIEKLLEAARTATVSTVNASSTLAPTSSPTTSTTTTTTTTPRPSTPGECVEKCELAGTIRIIGGKAWLPELLDRNTREWQQLANEVENEINTAFSKSAELSVWKKKIRIDSFSQGSILVDYFLQLNSTGNKVKTEDLKEMFHNSLTIYDASDGKNGSKTENELHLGTFTIDPKYTDFGVLPKSIPPKQIDNNDQIMPQWAIAVIVIGVGGLLFIIVFGVSVLINRQNVIKSKPSMSTVFEDEVQKNIVHRNHTSPVHGTHDYPKEDLYNMDAVWNDKPYESTSNKMLVDDLIQDNMKYNLYDSWRSEWNGYYYNPSHTSSKSPGYGSTTKISRQHPDYDTNF